MKIDMVMPQMGESITEGKILKWFKKTGDKISKDETVLEISTDKVDSEIPSPATGLLAEILVPEGDTVSVGTLIARIETDLSQPVETLKTTEQPVSTKKSVAESDIKKETAVATVKVASEKTDHFYSPVVKNIAKAENISDTELAAINGSGLAGRVTKEDVLHYLEQRKKGIVPAKVSSATSVKQVPVTKFEFTGERIEKIPMSNVRQITADHMRRSLDTSAHVYSLTEIDMNRIVRFRENNKIEFERREGFKLTYTPFMIDAMVKAVKDYPMINISVDGTTIIKKNYINISMAVSIENNTALIVPVIKDADQLNLTGIARAVHDIAGRARNKKLKPEDIQDGTIALTNMGGFGSLVGFPIINQPQVAILGIGAIKKRPIVIETPDGDTISIRPMMYASLSYDHRVVDGALGASYLERVAYYLEHFDTSISL
jgi:2-oxoglutarate dehydrogenase E2 component (dihydrolipoamide succinyltransferase)